MISTEAGMQIDLSDEHCQNARCSIRISLEFDSNVTLEREVQSPKEPEEMISTEAGMQIDLRDEQPENVESARRVIVELNSNSILSRKR
jgi:hypothetical protein